VNTYDPAHDVVYVHMSRETDPYCIPVDIGRRCTRLPVGYANRSLRTRLAGHRLHF
jgi:hypothetical protein